MKLIVILLFLLVIFCSFSDGRPMKKKKKRQESDDDDGEEDSRPGRRHYKTPHRHGRKRGKKYGYEPRQRVQDDYDAELFLEHYGYLSSPPYTGDSIQLKNEEDVRRAITMFQKTANVNQTGTIDSDTRTMMNAARCGLPDVPGVGGRAKRYSLHGTRWPSKTLSWRITKFTQELPEVDTRTEITSAFKYWADVSPLTFMEISTGRPDIEIRFETGMHGDGNAFDGTRGTLAHAFFPYEGKPGLPGDTHFDDAEVWTINSFDGTNLMSVAVHEFGHALGMLHSDVRGSTMWPYDQGYQPGFQLHPDDVAAIQAIYGRPDIEEGGETRTTTAMTTTTRKPRSTAAPRTTVPSDPNMCHGQIDAVSLAPNGHTYAFRGQFVYTLDHAFSFADPQRSHTVFPGLPSGFVAQAAFDMVTTTGKYLYLTNGNRVWRFDGSNALDAGYPKPIKKAFGLNVRNLDAAFSWGQNGKVYFFQRGRYWRATPGRGLDSGYPKPVTVWSDKLASMSAAMTWLNGKTYFFKGDQYYRYNDKDFQIDTGYPRDTAPVWFGCNP